MKNKYEVEIARVGENKERIAEAEKQGIKFVPMPKATGQNSLPPAVRQASAMSEEAIDENLRGTFPASDAPSWTLGVELSAVK